MKKSIIGPDFEKKDAVPPYSESKQALKLKHRVSFTNKCFLSVEVLWVELSILCFKVLFNGV